VSTLTAKSALLMGAGAVPVLVGQAAAAFLNNGATSSTATLTATAPAGRQVGDLLLDTGYVETVFTPLPPTGYSDLGAGATAGSRMFKRSASATAADDCSWAPNASSQAHASHLIVLRGVGATVTRGDQGAGNDMPGSAGFAGGAATVSVPPSTTGRPNAPGPGWEFLTVLLATSSGASSSLAYGAPPAGWLKLGEHLFFTLQGREGRCVVLARRIFAAGITPDDTVQINLTRTPTSATMGGVASRFAVTA